METVSPQKSEIANFSQAAEAYHQHATVQRQVAERLLASLKPWKEILPPGPILELGCGTGFTSQGLINLFPERPLIITDAAEGMLNACKKNIGDLDNVTFDLLDAESIPVEEETYAMTISSFVSQWFRHPGYTLGQWLEVTKPGGLLLAAFPGHESFPEWKQHAKTLGLPYTGNSLPDTEEMVVKLSSEITQVDYYEDTITQSFASAADFFRHLKKIGAGQQIEGRPLNAREMKMLIEHWDSQQDGDITVSWHVVFIAVKKNMV